MQHVTLEEARAAKAVAIQRFHGLFGLVGVGITKVANDYAVMLNLSDPTSADLVPSHLDGVPVRVEVTGSIRVQR
ncbi:MAG: hypothetical protein JWM27_4819 [Gemmatimonadetes bacterium]|nr:hypothetical protein [Gemmatimonadota bacterium]